ncbi:hypothetical protein WICPIJ_007149, partial [Wickerhamomyces pijperi]
FKLATLDPKISLTASSNFWNLIYFKISSVFSTLPKLGIHSLGLYLFLSKKSVNSTSPWFNPCWILLYFWYSWSEVRSLNPCLLASSLNKMAMILKRSINTRFGILLVMVLNALMMKIDS